MVGYFDSIFKEAGVSGTQTLRRPLNEVVVLEA